MKFKSKRQKLFQFSKTFLLMGWTKLVLVHLVSFDKVHILSTLLHTKGLPSKFNHHDFLWKWHLKMPFWVVSFLMTMALFLIIVGADLIFSWWSAIWSYWFQNWSTAQKFGTIWGQRYGRKPFWDQKKIYLLKKYSCARLNRTTGPPSPLRFEALPHHQAWSCTHDDNTGKFKYIDTTFLLYST